MNLADKLMRSQLELTKPIADRIGLDSSRAFQDRIGKIMHFTRRRDVVIDDVSLKDINSALILPRDELRGGVILYLHGGGYTCGTMDYAKGFASVLSAECGMRVVCVEYRLAPEHPFPAALEDALAAYLRIIAEGTPSEKIILCGESAGGGLCYSLCLKLRELGEPLPAGIIAISPWVDLALTGDSYLHNKEADPSLTRERLVFFADCFVGADCERDIGMKKAGKRSKGEERFEKLKREPLVSPLYADLTGMPPSLIFVGEDEILYSDSLSLKEKLVDEGCEATLISRKGMWHAYVLYCLKSNKGDFTAMNDFIKKKMPQGNERKLRWMHLDNAAKIYPAAATARWTNIFRLSMTLAEEIDTEVLQSALDVTVRRFPSIAVRLHRGMFWYYLEEIAKAPQVMEEKAYPLARMPFDDIRHCAFRVLVYKKRIAVEFFHALTDGNGGMVFLKTLVAEYLTEKYGVRIPAESGVLDRLEPPLEEELEDLFPKHKANVGKTRSERDAYRIFGTPEVGGFSHVTAFCLKCDELLDLAHKSGVSMTALLAAVFIKASITLQCQDVRVEKKQRRVKILIPCDLRRIYGGKTLRNFVLYSTAGVDPRLGEYTLDELCKIVQHKMALDITEKNMAARIYTNVHDEEKLILKLAPLFLKNIVMKAVFMAVGERKSTLTVSNLGDVKLPEAMKDFVKRVDFVLSAQSDAPYNAGVVSYDGTLYLNVIRNIREPRLERELYRVLREAGIAVKIESNLPEKFRNFERK